MRQLTGPVMRPSDRRLQRLEIVNQSGESFSPQANVDAIDADIDALHQQLDNAGLLGRKELVPERIEPVERLAELLPR